MASITFTTRSETVPTLIAAAVFLLPGVGSVIFGALTYAGITWIENTANGIMIGVTGTIWALVGIGILSFRRWITVDADKRVVLRGTRTVFRHPSERFPLDGFRAVEVRAQVIGDHRYYSVDLAWKDGSRQRDPFFWLHDYAGVEEARTEARAVSTTTGLPLVDRTRDGAP